HGLFNLKHFTEAKYALLKNYSATNFLIAKEFIKENDLKFSENIDVYTDVNFMIDALIQVETVPYVKEALYFKRRRNDSVRNPSLSQLSIENKVNDFLTMYIEQKGKHSQDFLANKYLDTHFLNFYRKHLISYFSIESSIDECFSLLVEAAEKLDYITLNTYDRILKQEMKPIYQNKKNSYKSVLRRHNFIRDLKKGIKSKRNFYKYIYEKIFTKLPINHKLVFFESFGGKNYSDSPKYIYEYLNKNNSEITSVWSFKEKTKIPRNSKQVKKQSLRYYYKLAKAKYWVTNARMPNSIKKRDNCIYIQTWHGTPLKKLAGDLDNVSMPGTNPVTYKRNFSNET